jgi:hypothetical protein
MSWLKDLKEEQEAKGVVFSDTVTERRILKKVGLADTEPIIGINYKEALLLTLGTPDYQVPHLFESLEWLRRSEEIPALLKKIQR